MSSYLDVDEHALGNRLRSLVLADPARMAALRALQASCVPDGWIGAGFVRNAVWDHLHDRPPAIRTDLDVAWFDPDRDDEATDCCFTDSLSRAVPDLRWSVRNQARMHRRNGDAPYISVADAMRFWPETATAVALRLAPGGSDRAAALQILAPFGLADLFALRLRPTPSMTGARQAVFENRVNARGWLLVWPGLQRVPAALPPETG